MRTRILFALGVVLASGGLLWGDPEPKAAPPAIPDDFKIVARCAPGYSDWLSWKTTITADGKVVQAIGVRGGGEPRIVEAKLMKDDVTKLVGLTQKADFFKLKDRYAAKVTDQATLYLEITTDKKTHTVAVYAHRAIQGKEDQDAVDRFLGIWAEVLRKVPSPNKEQNADLYKPGNYTKK